MPQSDFRAEKSHEMMVRLVALSARLASLIAKSERCLCKRINANSVLQCPFPKGPQTQSGNKQSAGLGKRVVDVWCGKNGCANKSRDSRHGLFRCSMVNKAQQDLKDPWNQPETYPKNPKHMAEL